MYCPNCGAEIPDGKRFCRMCGARLEDYEMPDELLSDGPRPEEQDSRGSVYEQVQKDRVISMPAQDEEVDESSDILYEPTIIAPGGSSSRVPQEQGRRASQEQGLSVSQEAAGRSSQDLPSRGEAARRFPAESARQVPQEQGGRMVRVQEDYGSGPAEEYEDDYTDSGYDRGETTGTGYDDEAGKGPATASLVLGILSIFFWFSFSFLSVAGPMIGLIFGIIGIICASLASKQGNRTGLRTAGFVCSLIGSIGNLLGFITCVACVGIFASVYGELFNSMAGGSV